MENKQNKYIVTVEVTSTIILRKEFSGENPTEAANLAHEDSWTPEDGWQQTSEDDSAEIIDIEEVIEN